MAANTFHIVLFFVGTITFASSSIPINCYDCDPKNFGTECGEPESNNVRVTTCAPDVENGTSICLSTFFKYTGDRSNETGIYRGCNTIRPDVIDFCDWFLEENRSQNLTIPSCVSCNTTKCNTVRFNTDGSSGASSMSFIVFVLAINTMLVIIFS